MQLIGYGQSLPALPVSFPMFLHFISKKLYNSLALVTSINYNDAKKVSYRYNPAGALAPMTEKS